MGRWVWRWNLVWRRELFDREKVTLNNLLELLKRFSLTEGEEDEFRWKTSKDGTYRTSEVYNMLVP